jgi:hypothetical protein
VTDLYVNTIVKEGMALSQEAFITSLAQRPYKLKGIEVRREYFSLDPVQREAEFLHILETGKHKKWQLLYSVPESLFLSNGLNPDLKVWLEEGKKMGIVSMKVNFGDLQGISSVSKDELNTLLSSYKIKLTVENDQTIENGVLSEVLKGLQLIEENQLSIGYTFDLGNWSVMDQDYEAAFKKMKKDISIFHLKNIDNKKQTVLLDEGVINWRLYLSTEYPIVLEYPMDWFALETEIKKILEVK